MSLFMHVACEDCHLYGPPVAICNLRGWGPGGWGAEVASFVGEHFDCDGLALKNEHLLEGWPDPAYCEEEP